MIDPGFSKSKSPLQDDALRLELQQAILANQPTLFREVLAKIDPELLNQVRVYGVLTSTPQGIIPIMVDNFGERLMPDYLLTPETPIDLLNVRYEGNEMIALIDGEEWRARLGGAPDEA